MARVLARPRVPLGVVIFAVLFGLPVLVACSLVYLAVAIPYQILRAVHYALGGRR